MEGQVLVMSSGGHPDVSLGGSTKLSRITNHGLAGVLCDGKLGDCARHRRARRLRRERQAHVPNEDDRLRRNCELINGTISSPSAVGTRL